MSPNAKITQRLGARFFFELVFMSDILLEMSEIFPDDVKNEFF